MPTRNADYWRGRFSVLENSAFNQSEQTVQNIEQMYIQAQNSVQKEIEAWYGRFAVNNGISLADARKMLTTGQLEEFRWTVDQYVTAGKKAGVDPTWLKKLENASAKVHVSRLEALQMQIQQQIELVNGNQVDAIDDLLKKVVGGNYTHTAYEIQKGLGLGWDMTGLDQRKLETLISKPWTTDGKTFRDRCWVNKQELVNTVNTQLVQGMVRGDSPEKAIQAIQKQFGVSRYKARRLVHTETSYFNAVSTKESYRELGVEQIEILETLDGRTCEICGGLDGTVIPISQYEPGVTVPPFHPNCRGTTCPHFDDMEDGERAARNADGEVYYVPANMKYSDWKAAFVDGGDKSGLTVAKVGDMIKNRRKAAIDKIREKKLWEGLPDEKRDAIVDALKNGDPDFIEMAEQCMDKCSVSWELDTEGTSYYMRGTGHITIYGGKPDDELPQTFWHEYGHYLDDPQVSGSQVKMITTTTRRDGKIDQWTHEGATWVSEELGYHNAVAKDIDHLLDDMGLSDRFYMKPPEDEYSKPWLYNKVTGTPIDMTAPGAWEEVSDLEHGLIRKFDDISGLTKARHYAVDQGYPVKPQYSKYFETYSTPKRHIIRTRPAFKGAEVEYHAAMDAYYKAVEAFEASHDMKAIWETQAALIEQAEAIKRKYGAVSDTVDGGVYGAFLSMISLGGHEPDYYRINSANVREGVANVFAAQVTGDSDIIDAFMQICPEMFELMKKGWMMRG